MSRADYLVNPAGVGDAQVLDVRWALTDPTAGITAYRQGHVAGAPFLDLETVLTGPHTDATLGRHPLPDATRLAAGLGELGVDPARPIVVYDQPGSSAAERAWWVLRWAGLDVKILDGGWPMWVASGGDVETSSPAVESSRLHLTVGHMPVVSADEVAAWPGALIDARAPERFRGEVEPIDKVAGHIPGAINRPVNRLWRADGTLPDEAELREYFAGIKQPVAVYCGSGVSADRGILALATIGVDAALYPPSWSGWSSDPARPVAVGE